MDWLEFHITTNAKHVDQLNDQLILLGAQAITLKNVNQTTTHLAAYSKNDNPFSEIPLSEDLILVALFDAEDRIEAIGTYLEKKRDEGLLKKFELQSVADEDWTRRCLDSFKPLRFGKRLWICPSWSTPPNPDAINVILDPGFAFGTGTHQTTAMCLEWLEENIHGNEIVIDYGCGSGILSLAALKLGAKKVFAIDNDPKAIEAIEKNAERNQITSPQLETSTPDNFKKQPADILVANILAQPLVELAPLFATLVKPKGKIVLSGILFMQADSIIKAYSPWFSMKTPIARDEWVRIDGEKLA